MKYLITGYNGQLGYDIKRELLKRGEKEENILATDVKDMDITQKDEVEKVITDFNPDVIFHCAAWTAVDIAEDNKDKVYKVNVEGTKNITEASIKVDAKLFYMSTDYVFDGTKPLSELYSEEDEVNPKNVYGMSKYLGEKEVRKNPKHFINRISWVFGINGTNFIKTMLRLSETHNELNVVDDQIGSPTYTVDLARLLVDMSETEKYGTYNSTNEDYTSWADFAEYIFKVNNKNVKVNHVSTEEYLEITKSKQAYRPRNSKFSKEKLKEAGFELLPTWEDATERYSEELKNEKKLVKEKK